MILRFVGVAAAYAALPVALALGLAQAVLALPPIRSDAKAAPDDAADVGEEAAGDDAEADRDGGDDPATEDGSAPGPERRPGVRQIAEPEALDEELEDPDAARRAQFFGGMPGFPMPGMPGPGNPMPGIPLPGFPGGGFPFVPPGAGAAAGAVAGNAPGFGGEQFGFSGVIVGGHTVPGGNGFVMRTWRIGPDGAMIEVPPAVPQAQQPQKKPRAAKPKAPADRAAVNAKKPPRRDDAAKTRRAPRANKPAPPAGAADNE